MFGPTLTVTLYTDVPVHLTLWWTAISPHLHLRPEEARGLRKLGLPDFCFVERFAIEQNEAGDTTTHTFTWPGWSPCLTRYFLFHGTYEGTPSPSNTAIFTFHYSGPWYRVQILTPRHTSTFTNPRPGYPVQTIYGTLVEPFP